MALAGGEKKKGRKKSKKHPKPKPQNHPQHFGSRGVVLLNLIAGQGERSAALAGAELSALPNAAGPAGGRHPEEIRSAPRRFILRDLAGLFTKP